MSLQKKILIIAESLDIEDSSGTKGRVALILNLKSLGHNIKVYHYSRKEITLPGIVTVSIPENRKSLLFFLSRMERYFRKYLKLQLNKPLENVFGFSFTLFNDRNSIVTALKKEKDFMPDLVFTLSKGGSFRPHHALLKIPKWYPKWVAYMHDPYPMHLYPKPYPWKEPGFKQKEEFIRKISEKAAFPVFPSLLLKEWMGQFFEGYKKKGLVIPHQLNDSNNFTPGELPDYFDAEKFNILHAGTLLQARTPFALVEAFEDLSVRNSEFRDNVNLYFIGKLGHHSQYLSRKSQEMDGLIAIDENRPFQEVNYIQQLSDINIILEARSDISPFLPGKFPHCVKANRTILHLGPENSETRRLLGKDYEYVATIDDKEKIISILEKLYSPWKEGKDFKLNRPDLETYLSEAHLKEVVEIMAHK